jgi:hypothetical protein
MNVIGFVLNAISLFGNGFFIGLLSQKINSVSGRKRNLINVYFFVAGVLLGITFIFNLLKCIKTT